MASENRQLDSQNSVLDDENNDLHNGIFKESRLLDGNNVQANGNAFLHDVIVFFLMETVFCVIEMGF